MKRKPEAKNLEPQKFAVGETVIILRPHLWSSCSGAVVSFSAGMHRVKIDAKDGETYPSGFHADVGARELEAYI